MPGARDLFGAAAPAAPAPARAPRRTLANGGPALSGGPPVYPPRTPGLTDLDPWQLRQIEELEETVGPGNYLGWAEPRGEGGELDERGKLASFRVYVRLRGEVRGFPSTTLQRALRLALETATEAPPCP